MWNGIAKYRMIERDPFVRTVYAVGCGSSPIAYKIRKENTMQQYWTINSIPFNWNPHSVSS